MIEAARSASSRARIEVSSKSLLVGLELP